VTTAPEIATGDDTSPSTHVLRPARAEDLLTCARIWRAALNDYLVPLAQPEVPDDLGAILRLYNHLIATDRSTFLVAERTGSHGQPAIDGFVSAVRRDRLWFLSMLFIVPRAQRQGLGRRLVEAVSPAGIAGIGGIAGTGDDLVRATATDSVQPISNALYASIGIVPRMPLFRFVGRAERPAELPPLPSTIDVARFDEIGVEGDGIGTSALSRELDALDREVLGFERRIDHAFLAAENRQGFLYCDRQGAAVGYGYTSEAGRVGPVAVADADLLGPVVGHLVTAIEPRGAFGVWMPGEADRAVVPLLRSGFRIDGFPTILCWDRPFADWSRALPISPGLL
jgi:GNAT superfamily N-acetyltransferase